MPFIHFHKPSPPPPPHSPYSSTHATLSQFLSLTLFAFFSQPCKKSTAKVSIIFHFITILIILPSPHHLPVLILNPSVPPLSFITILLCLLQPIIWTHFVFHSQSINLSIISRIVRLSSPNLNVVFIVGIILVYLMVVLFGIDSNLVPTWVVSGLCQTRLWLGVIAFTLVYGSILAQTFRVFYILRNIKVAQKKDKIKVVAR